VELIMILAGDIGGTKTALGIYSRRNGPYKPILEASFPSQDYDSLERIVKEFLTGKDLPLNGASIGVAGPVIGERAKVTNLPWVVEAKSLQEELEGIPVSLLNDLYAIASAIPHLDEDDLETINTGKAIANGAIAVIAPGTGLGEAYLVSDGRHYRACASEGGHADFGPNNELQDDLLIFLRKRYGHVSCERACSGKAIPDLYAFMKDSGRFQEPEWLREKITNVEDPTPIIADSAYKHHVELSMAAMDLFVSILGSEAGNMALKVLATGGVYLAGGIPPRILPQLKGGKFMADFTHKGRFTTFLADVPVKVILNPKAALIGAACHGLKL
jgi:glucokinase